MIRLDSILLIQKICQIRSHTYNRCIRIPRNRIFKLLLGMCMIDQSGCLFIRIGIQLHILSKQPVCIDQICIRHRTAVHCVKMAHQIFVIS